MQEGTQVTGKKKNKDDKPKSAAEKAAENQKRIADNRKARHQYDVLDTLECGIALVGSEVKSLRNGRVSLEEAYARLRDNEIWLIGCDIQEYAQANRYNHQPRRARKLLLHRREIEKFAAKATQQGLTLVPLKMYFKRGLAKVLLGVCRGRKLHDKREVLKKRQQNRDIQRAMRRG